MYLTAFGHLPGRRFGGLILYTLYIVVLRYYATGVMTAYDFREMALSFPDTEERSHMQHPDFRVDGKIFATLGPDLKWGMAKLTREQQQVFLRNAPSSFTPANGSWGESGATIIELEGADEEQVREALRSAWRNKHRQGAA